MATDDEKEEFSEGGQQLTLDLERNEELSDLVAELEPGDEIDATLVIVAKNDKTLTVELTSVREHDAALDEDDEEEEDEEEDEEMAEPEEGGTPGAIGGAY